MTVDMLKRCLGGLCLVSLVWSSGCSQMRKHSRYTARRPREIPAVVHYAPAPVQTAHVIAPVVPPPLPPVAPPSVPEEVAEPAPQVVEVPEPKIAEVAPPPPMPTPTDGAKQVSYVDITAHSCFGHADDYTWLSGQVSYSKLSTAWRLRYASVDETDRYGGCVTLVDDGNLEVLKEGMFVRVKGFVLNPEQKGIAPKFKVHSVQVLDRN